MNKKIEIKYEIFEDHVEELKKITVDIFNKEFHQVYGTFTIIINNFEYIPYPPEDLPLSAKGFFSELILTHFEFLIEAVLYLEKADYLCMKYIENPFTWLEIKVKGENLLISELEIEIDPLNNWIHTDQSLFLNAKVGSIEDSVLTRTEFISEIQLALGRFLGEIKEINPDLLRSIYFAKLIDFHNRI
ncbi:hypothetical protein P9578_12705 [Brevibacillus choshinensis]|uniref:hypothetical protein n=1 Tax=Brevibacillus choshinensis TaxID=54911 RepID=UPI002E22F986|nr:hypothetical protein [Brevibacillus choshinensis]